MAGVHAWLRLDVRRRWRSLLVLTVLIALAAGTVMTAVAGARRGASAAERLSAQTLPATVLVAPATPGFDWDPVRALLEVAALTEIVSGGFEIDGRAAPESMMLPPVDAEAMRKVERPVILAGRLADPARADEVVVTSAFVDTQGKGVGDAITLGLYAPGQVDTGQGPAEGRTNLTDVPWLLTNQQMNAAIAAGVDLNHTARATGPAVDARIVGVVRSPWFGDQVDSAGFVIPSPGLYARYTQHFLGARGLAATSALVRLDGGEESIAAFASSLAEATGRTDITLTNLASAVREMEDGTAFESTSLLIFGLVAVAASVVLIGVSVVRHATAAMSSLTSLGAVGMTPWQSRWATAAGPGMAAVVGSGIGAGGSVVASAWFPIGSAAPLEPAPGVDADGVVLAAGLAGVPVLVIVGAFAAAWLALRLTALGRPVRRSAISAALARAGFPAPVVIGSWFALEAGRGHRAVPVRSALLGSVVGVAGVLATATFGTAVDDAAANPVRFGYAHQLEAWVGFDNLENAPAEPVLNALAEAPGVVGVNNTRGQVAEVDGEQITVLTVDAVRVPVDYVVTEGRLPVAPGDVTMGLVAADVLGVGVGDTVAVRGTSGREELEVVGLAVTASGAGSVALTTARTYDALFDGEFMFHYGEISLVAGLDAETAIPPLYEAVASAAGVDPTSFGIRPAVPPDFMPFELRYVRPLPVFLTTFLVVLALAAVGHALATAVRRRRPDLAVARAVGMSAWQSRTVVITHSVTLALTGLIVGIPLGIALGRTLWRYVADVMYVHYVPPTAWPALFLAIPLALLSAVVLAAWPAQRASSMRVGQVLRAE